MSVSKEQIGFRKTALKQEGSFKPARKDCVAGVGVVKKPAPTKGK